MLTIILIIFIGKHFIKLAEAYNKNKWLYAVLGVISYYAGSIIGGVIIGVLSEVFGWYIDWENTLLMTLIAIPFGLGTVALFHYLLKKNFELNKPEPIQSIEDIGKSIEEEKEEEKPKFRI